MKEIILEGYIEFAGEAYDYEEYSDGSKRINKERNSRGFRINIKVTGDPKKHEEGIQALKDFYVKGNL